MPSSPALSGFEERSPGARSAARRLPVGAETTPASVSFRVWAPERRSVTAVVEALSRPLEVALQPEGNGYHSATSSEVHAGDRYRYRLDDASRLFPDPASRFQPTGPHGPSEVVDPTTFHWTDAGWRGVTRTGQVLYELHIGTFSPAGTWAGAMELLPHLVELGVTLVEVMPVADFSGDFGWGYDGVDLFAPTHLYGVPDDFRRFVDRAHALALGVILDVVYNHLGPDGNYWPQFSSYYFTDKHATDWGEAINFDGPHSGPVREIVAANAAYWIEEYHLDGLRFDATQDIHDDSAVHVLALATRAARRAAGQRSIFLAAENEAQDSRHLCAEGFGFDAVWNDDYHHSAMVALSGHSAAYYSDYRGNPQELISALKWGYLYQGQHHRWQQKRRGTPVLGCAPEQFVTFLQNHDQVANSAGGLRCHRLTSPGTHRALTALTLLGPGTPLLFQGEEFSSSAPFYFFAAPSPELAEVVAAGRKKFLTQFPNLALPDMQAQMPDPAARATFERCRLDWSERERHAEAWALHRDLLHLRRNDHVLSNPAATADGAVLGSEAFLLRFFGDEPDDRLLLVNLGHDLQLSPAPEPLLAEPAGHRWEVLWSSEDPRYGGHGTPTVEEQGRWFLPGRSAVLLGAKTEASA